MDHAIPLRPPAPALVRRTAWQLDLPAAAGWFAAFSTVTFLALRDGGYDTIVRSDVGLVAWWTVLLAAIVGVLPARIGRSGWTAIGLLGAFAAWTGVTSLWSENAGSSLTEVGRLAAYLGVLVLALGFQTKAGGRSVINGVASAIGVISVLAVLSRLHPQAFPADPHLQFLSPGSARKLSYPVNYWNGLAAFAAIGLPLLMGIAVGGRTLAGRALAAGTLPITALCVYLTVSRGGVLECGVGLAVFLLAVPRRPQALVILLITGAGAAILLAAAARHPAVQAGVPSPAEVAQGTDMIWLALIVGLGVALLAAAVSLATRQFPGLGLPRPGRRRTAQIAVLAAAVAVIIGVAAGLPGSLSHAWHDFKQPNGAIAAPSQATVFSRLQAANGNGRYQLWQAAWRAGESHPWTGIGPGTFQFWWSRHATTDGVVHNAHSLYLETFAETGIVGVALLGALLLWFPAVAVRKLLRGSEELRLWTATALGGLAAFLVAAAFEWVWQLAAVVAAALMLGAAIVGGRSAGADDRGRALTPRRQSIALVLMAVAALGAVLVPLAGALAIRNSQTAAARGNLATAYADALAAQSLEPYAEGPRLQQSLVLEAAGDLAGGAVAARAATRRGPTDWTAWLTLARIEARRGATGQALAAVGVARGLNPRSVLFARP